MASTMPITTRMPKKARIMGFTSKRFQGTVAQGENGRNGSGNL
jgi:hypothetical protein